jgi:hypothetical protein
MTTETATRKRLFWLLGASAICFFVGGAIWWRGSYQELNNSGFRTETVPVFAVVALFLAWFIGVRPVRGSLVLAGAFVAVILTRIVIDCSRVPSAHNLFPFEVGIAAVAGILMTLPFAGLGWLLRRITHRTGDASRVD